MYVRNVPEADPTRLTPLDPSRENLDSILLELLGELGRATTAYHEALPDRVECARQEYEESLRRFNMTREQYSMSVGCAVDIQSSSRLI